MVGETKSWVIHSKYTKQLHLHASTQPHNHTHTDTVVASQFKEQLGFIWRILCPLSLEVGRQGWEKLVADVGEGSQVSDEWIAFILASNT